VAFFYIDHDVANYVAASLTSNGHEVATVRNRRTIRAKDSYHLLTAADEGRILISLNRRDYALLHDAWQRWTNAWLIDAKHSGILLLPHTSPRRTVEAIEEFLRSGDPIESNLYEWTPKDGWLRPS